MQRYDDDDEDDGRCHHYDIQYILIQDEPVLVGARCEECEAVADSVTVGVTEPMMFILYQQQEDEEFTAGLFHVCWQCFFVKYNKCEYNHTDIMFHRR